MATIRKRVLPSGQVRWLVDYADLTGRRRYKQFLTKREALDHETRVRGQLADGTHVAPGASISVAEAADLWLERARREGLEPATIRQYRQHADLHICPILGAKRLSELTRPAIEVFRDQLLVDRSRPLVRAVITSLKGILKEAQRRGHVRQNVAADTGVKISSRMKPKVEIPTKAEIGAMLIKAAELWPLTRVETTRAGDQKIVAVPWHPLIVAALFTGLRASELRGLTWEHVDLAAGVIKVRQRADFEKRMGAPKSEAGNRDVPLAPMAVNLLKQWKLACPPTPLGLVFPSENGLIHTQQNVHKTCWRPLLRALGLVDILQDESGVDVEKPRYTFHHLRHAAASLFIDDGWSPKKIQTVMGHSSIQVTFDIYGHLWKNAEDDAKAMARIEARLFS